MKLNTTEFTIELLENNIITQKVNEDCSELTIKGIDEAIKAINKLTNSNKKLTKMLLYIAPFYVKKQVVKHFVTSRPQFVNVTALICPNFISKYVASIALKMYDRFYKEDDDLMKIKTFIDEDKAIEWLSSN